jgi:hypothetical protein
LNANPVITSESDKKIIKKDKSTIEKAISGIKINLEGDFKLHFDQGKKQKDRSVLLDKDKVSLKTVLDLKEKIIKGLEAENKQIFTEINHLVTQKITKENIENEDFDLSGISYTSVLIYVNEYLENK